MNQKSFGTLIEGARAKSKLTQAALAEIITAQSGIEVSQQAVAYWCQGRRIPRDRFTLLHLIRALYSKGGLQSREEINAILFVAGTGALHPEEEVQWFPNLPPAAQVEPPDAATSNSDSDSTPTPPYYPFWLQVLKAVFNLSEASVAQLQHARTSGPHPRWAGLFLVLFAILTQGWTAERVLRSCLGILLLLVTWFFTYPPLRWASLSNVLTQALILLLVGGGFIVPLLVAGFSDTKNDAFWVEKGLGGSKHVRIFTHLGAALGFHVGYTLLFFFTLLLYHVGVGSLPIWTEILLSLSPLLWSFTAARQVPYNMVRAYEKLQFTEREIPIAIAAFGLGPAIGGMYGVVSPFILNPWIGSLMLLGTFIALSGLILWQQKVGDGIIPAHIWAAIGGSAAICFELSRFSYWIFPAILTGLTVTLVQLLAQNRIRMTNYGMLILPLALSGVLVILTINLALGRIVTVIGVMIWVCFGRKLLWFPVLFWMVIALASLCVYLWSRGLLTDIYATLLYSTGLVLCFGIDRIFRKRLSSSPSS